MLDVPRRNPDAHEHAHDGGNREIEKRMFGKERDARDKREQDAHAHGTQPRAREVRLGLHRPEAERTAKDPEEPAKDAHRMQVELARNTCDYRRAEQGAHGHYGEERPRRIIRVFLERDHVCPESEDAYQDADNAERTTFQCRTPQK